MIKKLRRKFIRIAMLSVFSVLALLMGVINAANYINVLANADARVSLLTQNGTQTPQQPTAGTDDRQPFSPAASDGGAAQDGSAAEQEEQRRFRDGALSRGAPRYFMEEEAPFDSRFFTVSLLNGEPAQIDLGRIAAVDEEEAAALAGTAYAEKKSEGFTGVYRYTVLKTAAEEADVTYFFLDCSRELSTFYSFLYASVLVSALGLLLIFLMILLISKPAIRPVTESYEKQKQFITDASHELKTPLAVIQSATEVIEIAEGESEWTASIKNQVKRLTSLTEKLVLLSRMDEAGWKPDMRDFDLSAAVSEIAESFSAVAVNRGRRYETEIEPGVRMHGDEALVRQLCSLLIDNAMKYSNEGGDVRVSLRNSGRNRELCVYNTVEEIKKGPHGELFERFYRADASRASKTGGHGIGLSVARSIAELHKGKLAAFSDDGRSIRFTFTV